ncbi:MAG TPA: hypothetical protein VHL09_11955 [Dehalococcoidia bacterium]|nr:hypothetical protein [Dehalococcoidia bacterium]
MSRSRDRGEDMLPGSGTPQTSQLIVTVADRLARRASGEAPPHVAFLASEACRTWIIRRTLEELGIHCEEAADLQALAGFLIASERGVEIVTSAGLSPRDQAQVYTQLLAQLLLEPGQLPFLVRFEYLAGRDPARRSAREIRTGRVAAALGRAILEGRLHGAPKLLYQGPPIDPPGSLKKTAAHLLLRALHRASVTLYWRSGRYQRLRALPLTTQVITKVEEFLGDPPAVAS